MKQSTEERFWDKVWRGDGCWLWTGCGTHGYGSFWDGERPVRAHRYAYGLLVGPIPEGLELDHTCHNIDRECPGGPGCFHRSCVNPDHLEPVTHKENNFRGKGVTAHHARKTHCIHGHPFSGDNMTLLVTNDGVERRCRACQYETNQRKVRK